MLKILKGVGYDLNQVDEHGWTPADRAYANCAYDCARYLMLE
jgi:hypothetical protein